MQNKTSSSFGHYATSPQIAFNMSTFLSLADEVTLCDCSGSAPRKWTVLSLSSIMCIRFRSKVCGSCKWLAGPAVVVELLDQTLHVSQASTLILCARVWRQATFALPQAHCPSGWMKPDANFPAAIPPASRLKTHPGMY